MMSIDNLCFFKNHTNLTNKMTFNRHPMKKLLTIIFVSVLAQFHASANAATVKCMFWNETQLSTNGEWLKSGADIMKLAEMFGDGLQLPLKNSVLGKLDTKQPFLAGEVSRGKVFLMGTEAGVEGKLINVKGGVVTIYDGMCTVSFG
jgi:hypothetical protein